MVDDAVVVSAATVEIFGKLPRGGIAQYSLLVLYSALRGVYDARHSQGHHTIWRNAKQ